MRPSREMGRPALALISVVLLLVLAVLASAPTGVGATGPNPIGGDWEPISDLMETPSDDEDDYALGTATEINALSRVQVARTIYGSLPKLKSAAYIPLDAGPLSAGWKIGTTGAKWLEVTCKPTVMCGTTDEKIVLGWHAYATGWVWVEGHTPSGWYEAPPECDPGCWWLSSWLDGVGGYAEWACNNECNARGALLAVFQDSELTFGTFHEAVPNATIARYATAEEMEDALNFGPIEDWSTQPVDMTTSSFTPGSDPGDESEAADAIREILAGSSNRVDFKVAKLIDSGYDGQGGSSLLNVFAPNLWYDSSEQFFADAADQITDNYDPEHEYENKLYRGESPTLVTGSDITLHSPALSLETLNGEEYADESPVSAADYIDEANGSYQTDSDRMRGSFQYSDKIYGRWIADGSGGHFLQYWIFYYYQPPRLVGAGEHEGDWELVQIHVDSEEAAIGATYSRHGTQEYCAWEHVPRVEFDRAVAFVAYASHANYFSSGLHSYEAGAVIDDGDGAGAHVTPTVIDITAEPDWLEWPGKWGGSGSSPRGPKLHDEWDEVDFESEANSCTEEQVFTGE